MSNTHLQYIYDAQEFEEYEEFTEDLRRTEHQPGPVLMGRERDYFNRQKEAINEFELQNNADLAAEYKKKVDTTPQLFGISNQNHNQRVSLDEKFSGDMLYKVTADNMSPFILPNTYVMLKFSEQHASGEICVFRYRGKTYCNQIKIINNKVVAISLNQKYKPVVLDPDDYIFIAVVSSVHRALK